MVDHETIRRQNTHCREIITMWGHLGVDVNGEAHTPASPILPDFSSRQDSILPVVSM